MERDFRVFPPPKREPLLPNEVLATGVFLFTEIMMFGGFISAFSITKSSATVWPPPDQPRLPIETTAFTTAALIASGVLFWLAVRRFKNDPAEARTPMLVSMLLGAFFVVAQGVEWVQLIGEGLTLTSAAFGAFFYVIVGMHALHAIAGLTVLIWCYRQLTRGELTAPQLTATQMFWTFVVGLWPLLYWQVYL